MSGQQYQRTIKGSQGH